MRYRAFLFSLLALLVFSLASNSASAISGSDFQAGRIIDDSVFFDGESINTGTIQSFLNSKVPACDTTGAKPSNGTTRAIYGTSAGYPPPYTCLRDYQLDTPTKGAESGLCSQYNGGNKSAAQIIFDVGKACGVSPKVLLILLEKEQSLVTDDWPWSKQYQSATGYACPDTAVCDTAYYGFFNQVYQAARQFKLYGKNSTDYRYRSGRTNTVYYNPGPCQTRDPNGTCTLYYGRFQNRPDIEYCGSTELFIQNQATAGLYNYTPYQPNASALNNLGGGGDICGAYGNRNFWKLFTDWFGPTTSNSTANTLNFVRLNHYSGQIELIGYPSIGNYSYSNRSVLTPYAASTSVIPLFRPNGDMSIIKLNDPSGKVSVATYSAASNFQQLSSQIYTSYPAVPADGSVIPMFRPNGDLSFIRLNHYAGKVEVVTYSFGSYFQQLSSQIYTSYPAVPADGSVIPMFLPNGNLSFVRLNHSAGKVEVVTYSFGSYFQVIDQHIFSGYPSIQDTANVKVIVSR